MTSRWAKWVGGSQALARTVFVEVQQKVLNAEGKDVLRDVAFELNDLNDGKTEVGFPGSWLGERLEVGCISVRSNMNPPPRGFPESSQDFCVFWHMIIWPFDQKETWTSSNYFGRVWYFVSGTMLRYVFFFGGGYIGCTTCRTGKGVDPRKARWLVAKQGSFIGGMTENSNHP